MQRLVLQMVRRALQRQMRLTQPIRYQSDPTRKTRTIQWSSLVAKLFKEASLDLVCQLRAMLMGGMRDNRVLQALKMWAGRITHNLFQVAQPVPKLLRMTQICNQRSLLTKPWRSQLVACTREICSKSIATYTFKTPNYSLRISRKFQTEAGLVERQLKSRGSPHLRAEEKDGSPLGSGYHQARGCHRPKEPRTLIRKKQSQVLNNRSNPRLISSSRQIPWLTPTRESQRTSAPQSIT